MLSKNIKINTMVKISNFYFFKPFIVDKHTFDPFWHLKFCEGSNFDKWNFVKSLNRTQFFFGQTDPWFTTNPRTYSLITLVLRL